jgi:hypothetical protein
MADQQTPDNASSDLLNLKRNQARKKSVLHATDVLQDPNHSYAQRLRDLGYFVDEGYYWATTNPDGSFTGKMEWRRTER